MLRISELSKMSQVAMQLGHMLKSEISTKASLFEDFRNHCVRVRLFCILHYNPARRRELVARTVESGFCTLDICFVCEYFHQDLTDSNLCGIAYRVSERLAHALLETVCSCSSSHRIFSYNMMWIRSQAEEVSLRFAERFFQALCYNNTG